MKTMRSSSPETLSYASKEECILVFLSTGEKTVLGKDIQDAYKTWQKLTPSYKWKMDIQIQKSLKGIVQKELYESLIRGFEIWDHTQTLDGAPGWNIKDSSINDVLKHIGEELLCLLHTLDEAWANCKCKASNKTKTSELSSADSEECIFGGRRLTSSSSVEAFREKEDVVVTGTKGNYSSGINANELKENGDIVTGTKDCNSSGMDANELPLNLPILSEEEKVEEFRKVHFKKMFEETEKQSVNKSDLDTSQVADDHEDDQSEAGSPTVSKFKDPMDMSLDEVLHLRNLRLGDSLDDSDLEKQISPLVSEDEA